MLNIVSKDVTCPKLTIAKDRKELKLPIKLYNSPEAQKIIQLANIIIEEFSVN